MIWLSRIVKYHDARIDENNRVSIQTLKKRDILEKEELAAGKPEPDYELQGKVIAAQIVEDAKTRAKLIISNAHKEVEDIIEDAKETAHKQAISIRENAYKEGYNDGVEKANELSDEMKAEVEVLRHEGEEYCQNLIRQVEPDMIDLIRDILDKLLLSEVKINPRVISILIRQGLSKATLTEDVSVHVSKDDYTSIIEFRDEILASLDTMVSIDFIEDPTLKKSDCVIETGFGSVDCSLSVQYTELKKNLYYILKNR